GIDIALSAVVAGNQNVSVKNTIIENCGGAAVSASNTAGGGAVIVTLDGVHADHSGQGFKSSTSCTAVLTNSTFNFNNAGVLVAAGTSSVDIDTCVMSGNGDGIQTAAATTRIANCRISANGNGINFTGGVVQSFGDNKV